MLGADTFILNRNPFTKNLQTLLENLPTLEPDLLGEQVARLRLLFAENQILSEFYFTVEKLLPRLQQPAIVMTADAKVLPEQALKNLINDITTVEKQLTSFLKADLHIYIQQIKEIYETALKNWNGASDFQKKEMLKPKATLTGDSIGFYFVSQEIARKLLCCDHYGMKVKQNAEGNHSVVAFGGVHFKPNPEGHDYLELGRETTLMTLARVLSPQEITTQVGLLKIGHVYIEKPLLDVKSKDELEKELGLVSNELSQERADQHIKACKKIQSQRIGRAFEQVLQAEPEAAKHLFMKPCLIERVVQASNTINGISFYELLQLVRRFKLWIVGKDSKEFVEIFNCWQQEVYIEEFLNTYPRIKDALSAIEKQAEQIDTATSQSLKQEISQWFWTHRSRLNFEDLDLNTTENRFNDMLFDPLWSSCKYPYKDIVALIALIWKWPHLLSNDLFATLFRIPKALSLIRILFPHSSAEQIFIQIPDLLTKINTENYAYLCLLSFLVNPEDGKADNSIAVINKNSEGEITEISLVQIDSDKFGESSFFPRRPEKGESSETLLNVKDILYLLPQYTQPLPLTVREYFLKRTPPEYITLFLYLLKQQNQLYYRLIKLGVLKKSDLVELNSGQPCLDVPIKINVSELQYIAIKLERLHRILSNIPLDEVIILQQLHGHIEPVISVTYTCLLEQKGDPLAALSTLYARGGPSIEKIMGNKLQKLVATAPYKEQNVITIAQYLINLLLAAKKASLVVDVSTFFTYYFFRQNNSLLSQTISKYNYDTFTQLCLLGAGHYLDVEKAIKWLRHEEAQWGAYLYAHLINVLSQTNFEFALQWLRENTSSKPSLVSNKTYLEKELDQPALERWVIFRLLKYISPSANLMSPYQIVSSPTGEMHYVTLPIQTMSLQDFFSKQTVERGPIFKQSFAWLLCLSLVWNFRQHQVNYGVCIGEEGPYIIIEGTVALKNETSSEQHGIYCLEEMGEFLASEVVEVLKNLDVQANIGLFLGELSKYQELLFGMKALQEDQIAYSVNRLLALKKFLVKHPKVSGITLLEKFKPSVAMYWQAAISKKKTIQERLLDEAISPPSIFNLSAQKKIFGWNPFSYFVKEAAFNSEKELQEAVKIFDGYAEVVYELEQGNKNAWLELKSIDAKVLVAEHLTFSNLDPQICREILQALAGLPLTKLHLHGCSVLQFSHLQSALSFKKALFSNVRYLDVLNISGCNFSEKEVFAITKALMHSPLRKFYLGKITALTSFKLRQTPQEFPRLKSMSFDGCNNLKQCVLNVNLVHLSIEGCSNLQLLEVSSIHLQRLKTDKTHAELKIYLQRILLQSPYLLIYQPKQFIEIIDLKLALKLQMLLHQMGKNSESLGKLIKELYLNHEVNLSLIKPAASKNVYANFAELISAYSSAILLTKHIECMDQMATPKAIIFDGPQYKNIVMMTSDKSGGVLIAKNDSTVEEVAKEGEFNALPIPVAKQSSAIEAMVCLCNGDIATTRSYIAGNGVMHEILIFHGVTKELRASLPVNAASVRSLVSYGIFLISGAQDGFLKIWNVFAEPPYELSTAQSHPAFAISCILPIVAGKILVADEKGNISDWRYAPEFGTSLSLVTTQKIHEKQITAMIHSSYWVMTAALDGTIAIFNAYGNKMRVQKRLAHDKIKRKPYYALTIIPSGDFLLSATHNTVEMWHWQNGICLHEIKIQNGGILSLAVLSHEVLVATSQNIVKLQFPTIEIKLNTVAALITDASKTNPLNIYYKVLHENQGYKVYLNLATLSADNFSFALAELKKYMRFSLGLGEEWVSNTKQQLVIFRYLTSLQKSQWVQALNMLNIPRQGHIVKLVTAQAASKNTLLKFAQLTKLPEAYSLSPALASQSLVFFKNSSGSSSKEEVHEVLNQTATLRC